MREPVLFFDIDGVLHPNGAVALGADGRVQPVNAFCWLRPFEETIREFPGTRLVLHSNWRLKWEADAALKAQLPASLAQRLDAVTPRDVAGRYASIEAYCIRHGAQQFVILDDEIEEFPPGLPQLVACGPEGVNCLDTVAQLWRSLKRMWENRNANC